MFNILFYYFYVMQRSERVASRCFELNKEFIAYGLTVLVQQVCGHCKQFATLGEPKL